MKVAVIGAGISGMSAAHFLKDRYDVTVFEKELTPGGLIRCKRVDGNLFHMCGGHVFNSKSQDVLDWFWSMISREENFDKVERNSVVFMLDGLEIPYPIENHMYMFPAETQKAIIDDLVSMSGKNNSSPANFEEFLRARFGETLYNMYFKPYNKKVWRRDLKYVPLTWLEGKLPMPTAAEIVFNNINHVKEKTFVHSTFWYEKVNGSQFIADKLSDGLNIVYGSEVDKLTRVGDQWLVCNHMFDKVVFCGNIKQMARIIDGVDISKYVTDINSLEYHGTTAVFCEIDSNPYSWIYQPSEEHDSHRIICTGNFAKSNNSNLPEGRITATVEFTDEIGIDEIKKNLSRIPLHPKYLDHIYNKYTYPIQDAGTRKMIRDLKSVLARDNFFFTGRFADWEYYNMDVAIAAAMDLCKMI